MSINEIVLSEYFYPFNQLSEQDFKNHRFIQLPQHCSVSSAFVTNGNYQPIFSALKVDKLRLLKKLIESKHVTETWLKFCSNINYKSFMFFNINIKYGYKVVASTKAVYGHNAMLIIPSDSDKTAEVGDFVKIQILSFCENSEKLNYANSTFLDHEVTISKYIETHFRQESLLSKVFDCFGSPFSLIFPKPKSNGLRYDTTVHLLFNFTKEFNVSLSQILQDLKKLVQKPLNIIALDPHEISTDNFDQHEISGNVINLILMGLKIRYVIEKDFPICVGISDKDQTNVNEVISEISTEQLKLSTAMGLKRTSEAKEIITEIYKNISSLLNSMFSQYANYFSENFENDSTVIFPKIPFAKTLLEDCKKIYQLLQRNFTVLNGQIFFKWNESTKFWMATDEINNNENYGIIVTEENFETMKEMSENFGNNVFWGLNLSVNFNNIEPLIFIGNQETQFGFADGNFGSAENAENAESGEIKGEEELLFTPCSCQSLQFRHWICKSCWSLVKIVDSGQVCCGCGISKIGSLQKECFQCILNSKANVSNRHHRRSSKDFNDARNQLSNFFKLQDPPKKRPKKLKKVEIIPPDPHISSPKASSGYVPPPPPPLPSISSTTTTTTMQPTVPTVSVVQPPLGDDITLALEQLHEKVKTATELCDDVLQKVAKKEIIKSNANSVVDDLQKPSESTEIAAGDAIVEPVEEESSLEALKQKVEEALEYVEEIKEHEESKANSEA